MKKEQYLYRDCGLDNVIVHNIDFATDANGNSVYEIPNILGLHKAIAIAILSQNRHLRAKEVRFLRTECGWTQADLAVKLSKKALTVGRWERAQYPIDKNDDVLMRLIFGETLSIDKSINVADMLRDCGDIVEMEFLEIEGSDPANYQPVGTQLSAA